MTAVKVRSENVSTATSHVGTVRRIQALVYMGWSQQLIAEVAEVSTRAIDRALAGVPSCPSTQRGIGGAYAMLWNRQAPQRTDAERISAARAHRRAVRNGWVSPLAWDDIDRDRRPQHGARPDYGYIDRVAVELAVAGHHVPLTPVEREEAVRICHDRRLSDQQIANLLGCSDRTVQRIRGRLHLDANFDARKVVLR